MFKHTAVTNKSVEAPFITIMAGKYLILLACKAFVDMSSQEAVTEILKTTLLKN
jgi:hypothetical protein